MNQGGGGENQGANQGKGLRQDSTDLAMSSTDLAMSSTDLAMSSTDLAVQYTTVGVVCTFCRLQEQVINARAHALLPTPHRSKYLPYSTVQCSAVQYTTVGRL